MTMTRYRSIHVAAALTLALAGCNGGSNYSAPGYTVGGTISGLGSVNGLVLANGSDTVTVDANATTFTLPMGVANASTYNVTVQSHPPLETCSVTGGQGPVSGADVTNVSVACTPGTESVLYSFATTGGDVSYPYLQHLLLASDGNFYGLSYYGAANNKGGVFKITPAGTETVLWSFGGVNDGSEPYGSLIQGTDGNFYGTTYEGGVNDEGTVFKITTAGAETVLWSFGSAGDGSYPYGSLTQGSDGNLYGMTYEGGTNDKGIVFKITTAGSESVLWSFGSGADGAYPYGNSLVQGSDGNFYGMTYEGGTNNDGTVFKITTAGVETALWSFGSGSDGSYPYGSLVQGTDGNFYGLTKGGGAGDGIAFKITTAGVETVLWSFAGGSDGSEPYGSLVQGSDGNFYGMTYEGGANDEGILFQLTPGGAETVVWSFGAGSDAREEYSDLTFGTDGTLYGLSYEGGANGAGAVIKFD